MATTVVIINDFAHTNGGASKIALTSAIALAEKGLTVILFTAVGPISPELAASGVTVVCTGQHEILADPSRFRAITQGIWNTTAGRRLGEVLDGLDPSRTVVHLHSWTKALSSSVVRTAIRKKFRVVCTLHDYFTVCPNGVFFNFQGNNICRHEPMSSRCIASNCDSRSYTHKLWRAVRQGVQNRFGMVPRGICHFIAPSSFSSDRLHTYLPAGAKIHLLANVIDVRKGTPAPAARNSIFLFIGRLAKEKGPLLLAEAASSAGLEVVFVGEGECAGTIERISPSATITGWVGRDELSDWLGRARALVIPSLCYETFGLVALEAAAAGVPAIVSDTCAARDLVVDGETGSWFAGGNVPDLIRKMNQFQDDILVGTLGSAAYDRYWSQPLTKEAHADKLATIYEEIMRDTPPEC